MKVRNIRFLVVLFVIILSFISAHGFAEENQEDMAVPAVSDFALIGPGTNQLMLNPNVIKEQLNPFPTPDQLQWFDVNRDLHINDFDAQQFETIIDSMNGDKLSGMQLTIRFRLLQKNQKETFPLIYDLDRDGMFTPFDVDYFSGLISKLDPGSSRGLQLVEKLKNEVSTSTSSVS